MMNHQQLEARTSTNHPSKRSTKGNMLNLGSVPHGSPWTDFSQGGSPFYRWTVSQEVENAIEVISVTPPLRGLLIKVKNI